jgi:hypothetical protein
MEEYGAWTQQPEDDYSYLDFLKGIPTDWKERLNDLLIFDSLYDTYLFIR